MPVNFRHWWFDFISDKPKVFCLCREPERPNMIGCDFCDEWYHYNCLNLTKSEAKELTKKEWTCPNCEFKSSGKNYL